MNALLSRRPCHFLLIAALAIGCYRKDAPVADATDDKGRSASLQQVDGGKSGRLAALKGLGVSRDGRLLAVVRIATVSSFQVLEPQFYERMESTVFLVALPGNKLVGTISLPGKLVEAWYGVSWAPDSRWLALSVVGKDDPWSIWQVTVPEGNASRLCSWKTEEVQSYDILQRPIVSPDGKSVLFRSAHQQDLMLQTLGEKQPRFITNLGDVKRLGFDWSGDGSCVYFSRGHLSEGKGLFRVRADGTQLAPLPGSETWTAASLRVSPATNMLAFVGPDEGLFVTSVDNFRPRRVSSEKMVANVVFNWSPNGEALAFAEFERGSKQGRIRIWSGDEGPRQIAAGYFPVWSTNQQIVLLRDQAEVRSYDLASGKEDRVFALPQEEAAGDRRQ